MMPTSGSQTAELLARVQRVFGIQPILEAVPRRKEIVFIRNAPSAAMLASVDERLAQAAVDRLARAEWPEARELAALEACIRFMRPALFVEYSRIRASPAGRLPLTPNQQAAIERLLPAIAAVGLASEPLGLATGFLIGPRAILTNDHVAEALEKRFGTPLRAGMAVARFGLERAPEERFPTIRVRGVLVRDQGLDAAVLELESEGPAPHALPLAKAAPPAAGRVIITLGYPQKDPLQPLFVEAVFENIYGVKRASPGEILGSTNRALFHDCSTLTGNSGSPVVDGANAVVVGLHRTGMFAYRNDATRLDAVFAEPRFREHGVDWR